MIIYKISLHKMISHILSLSLTKIFDIKKLNKIEIFVRKNLWFILLILFLIILFLHYFHFDFDSKLLGAHHYYYSYYY